MLVNIILHEGPLFFPIVMGPAPEYNNTLKTIRSLADRKIERLKRFTDGQMYGVAVP